MVASLHPGTLGSTKALCLGAVLNSEVTDKMQKSTALEEPWMEEPGGLQSMGSLRVGHDLATEQQQQMYNSNQS